VAVPFFQGNHSLQHVKELFNYFTNYFVDEKLPKAKYERLITTH